MKLEGVLAVVVLFAIAALLILAEKAQEVVNLVEPRKK